MTALVILITNTWSRGPVAAVTAVSRTEPRVTIAFDPNMPDQLRHVRGQLTVKIYPDSPQGEILDARIDVLNGRRVDRNVKASSPESGELLVDVGPQDWPSVADQIRPGQHVHLHLEGVELSTLAYDRGLPGWGFGTFVVMAGVCLFAFSTMISWSYYGEKGIEFLLGPKAILPYKFLFVTMIVVGTLSEAFKPIYDFSDAMFGLMVFCNLPAALVLLPRVLRARRNYFDRLGRGRMPRTR
jgi:hypothetical protein